MKIAEQRLDFLSALSEANHQSGLRQHIRTHFPCEPQHIEGLLVIRLRPYTAVEARDGLHIVIEHVRGGVKDSLDCEQITAEIGGEDLHARVWNSLPNLSNSLREVMRSAVIQVVAIHARDHHVSQPHSGRHLGHMERLFRVEGELPFRGRSFRDRTESAAPGAKVTEDHESGGAAVEALMDVGTAGRLAHGVQLQLAQIPLQQRDRFEMRVSFSKPFGQARLRATLDLNQRVHQ